MQDTETIHDLQSRLAFQEDLLVTLNQRIAEQANDIDTMKAQLQHIYKKMLNMENNLSGDEDDVPPPHY